MNLGRGSELVLPVILLFLFERFFSSFGCLGKAVLFYCGTP